MTGDENRETDDFANVTEVWRGDYFETGLPLPETMTMFCQLTLNYTHVFFADGGNDYSYLLDWYAKTWTPLPPMPLSFSYPSCGLINNPENGIEAVLQGGTSSLIFNFNDEAWRDGPEFRDADGAGYAQLTDTFVVLGGYGKVGEVNEDPLDTIFIFDHLNYEWILMDQKLRVPRVGYPGVVPVPDNFVSCS